MNRIVMAWRWMLRDLRSGDLLPVAMAVVVAVAAMTSVGLFVDRLDHALRVQSTQMIGADVVVRADRPVPPEFGAEAVRRGLRTSGTVVFPSMAAGQLVALKAVGPGYPLRGTLQIRPLRPAPSGGAPSAGAPPGAASEGAPPAGAPPDAASGGVPPGAASSAGASSVTDRDSGPRPGVVWVDAALADVVGLHAGDSIDVGQRRFPVEAILVTEPDRGISFVNLAPRVMMAIDDLPSTGLIQPGSRATWRLLAASDAERDNRDFLRWVTARRSAGIDVEGIDQGRPEVQANVDRARQFLSLAALLCALLASIAIAMASRRFARRRIDTVAVLRTLGLARRDVVFVLVGELIATALAAGLCGAVAGVGVQAVLMAAVPDLQAAAGSSLSGLAVVQAVVAGLLLVCGFGLAPIAAVAGVAPARVLRRLSDETGISATGSVASGLIAFFAVMLMLVRDLTLSAWAMAGFAAAGLVTAAALWLVALIVPALARAVPPASRVRHALNGWLRHRDGRVLQGSAIALGLMALLLLTVTRADLLQSWARTIPPDAPDRFVINIQPDQVDGVRAMLAERGIDQPLYPMVRGRLVAIDGRPVDSAALASDRARRLVEREFNLSYMDALPAGNAIVRGRWIDPARAEASGEIGLEDTIGLHPGQKLEFDVAGERVAVTLVGSRKLGWDSMRVNFFMILSPSALDGMPATWITSFHLPTADPDLVRRLVARHPNLTVIDVGSILRQVREIIDRISNAVQLLFVLSLAAGMLVLHAALLNTRDERRREAALMRAFGCSTRALWAGQAGELIVNGALSGLLAAAGSIATGALLARQVFSFGFSASFWTLPAGCVLGAVVSLAAGSWALRGVTRTPPLHVLRRSD